MFFAERFWNFCILQQATIISNLVETFSYKPVVQQWGQVCSKFSKFVYGPVGTRMYRYQPPRELRLWTRYIDGVILLWEGDLPSLEAFLLKLNQNDRGISLQHEASQTHMHFLDLNFTVKDGRLTTSTYFKETDRNSFIPLTSCYHKSWLAAVPKAQFQRIRQNCAEISEFYQQALVLKQRFLNKGYQEYEIDETIANVAARDRRDMLSGRRENLNIQGRSIFETYYRP